MPIYYFSNCQFPVLSVFLLFKPINTKSNFTFCAREILSTNNLQLATCLVLHKGVDIYNGFILDLVNSFKITTEYQVDELYFRKDQQRLRLMGILLVAKKISENTIQ